ncbi:MAG TPA: metal-dependent hydrolase [Polyangiaceae bacterium]
MPFTPFHFGPAILLKALAPRHVSLTAFALSQVAIDIESGYHLLREEWPVHRIIHTLPVATAAGVAVGTVVWLAGRRTAPARSPEIQAEVQALPAYAGGLLGGSSHSVLDAIMHADVQPFWPFAHSNPLLGALDIAQLHLSCVVTGVCGIAVFIWKALQRSAA